MLSCCIFTQFPGECLLNCRDQTQFHGVSTGLSRGREKRVRLLLVNRNNHGRGLPGAGLCCPRPSNLLNILQANWFSVKTKDWYFEDHTFTIEQGNVTTSIHRPLLQFNGGLIKCCNAEVFFGDDCAVRVWAWPQCAAAARQGRGPDTGDGNKLFMCNQYTRNPRLSTLQWDCFLSKLLLW